MVNINVTLDETTTTSTYALFLRYKDIFAWNYIDFKGIPPHIIQHHIKLGRTIPLAH
jgi:hypothetical protein